MLILYGLSYDDRQEMWDGALTTRAADNHIYVAESEGGEVDDYRHDDANAH